jgi:hypothetical protein
MDGFSIHLSKTVSQELEAHSLLMMGQMDGGCKGCVLGGQIEAQRWLLAGNVWSFQE